MNCRCRDGLSQHHEKIHEFPTCLITICKAQCGEDRQFRFDTSLPISSSRPISAAGVNHDDVITDRRGGGLSDLPALVATINIVACLPYPIPFFVAKQSVRSIAFIYISRLNWLTLISKLNG